MLRFRKYITRNERGQASVLIGMMVVTLLMFFAFVVNTGMLINAKINLQNAADLAAYAGASVQARQLNQISYLNYEMRRAYKKFLFRYYVIGGMSQDSMFDSSSGQRGWYPSREDRSQDFNFPAVCIAFSAGDNYCHVKQLEKIKIGSTSSLDMIQNTLTQQLLEIENIRQSNCKNISTTNGTVLALWLWNTDPDLKTLADEIKKTDQKNSNMVQIIRGLSTGLGLIPKEMILKQRIDTLTGYLNMAPQRRMALQDANQMLNSSPDAAAHERSVQAFFSAYNTLGNHIFDEADSPIEMEELMTNTSAVIKPIQVTFDTFSVDFDARVQPDATGKNAPADCIIRLTPSIVNVGLPVGVYKDPTVLTYYAVKLQAKAKVMFSPFGPMTLRAYAAAQPFGSRIGPALTESDWVRPHDSPICNDDTEIFKTNLPCQKKIPNLPLTAGDAAARGKGWDTNDVIQAMFKSLQQGTSGLSTTITSDNLETAYQIAMAPNPWERGKYNILNSLPDPFFNEMQDNSYAFWAPVFSNDPAVSGGSTDPKKKIENMIKQLQINTTGAAKGPGIVPLSDQIQAGLIAGLGNYMEKLRQGQGENRESLWVARLSDTLKVAKPGGLPQPVALDSKYLMSDPQDVKTSWNKVNDSTFRSQGRVGYSVKFVSFRSLTGGKILTDGTKTSATNTDLGSGDSEAQDDLQQINH